MIVLDTNVLIYAVGSDHPLRKPSQRVFDEVAAGSLPATTTADVIQEFAHIYARRRPRQDAVRQARKFAAVLSPLLEVTDAAVGPALRLFESHSGLNAFDALLAAAAIQADARALVSADRAFAGIRRLSFVELGSPELERLLAA